VAIYSIYSGVDQLGLIGTVAPGIFAQEGRCWRMVHLNVGGPGWALHGASRVAGPLEVPHGMEASVVV